MKYSACPICLISLLSAIVLLSPGTSASPVNRSEPSNACSRSAPCGWYVYKPYVRTLEYHVHGPCTCPSETKCARVADDIAISAYVYRCLNAEESTGKEILPPNPEPESNQTANES